MKIHRFVDGLFTLAVFSLTALAQANPACEALSEAQRYPADYDGIVAGALANHPTQMWPYPQVAVYKGSGSIDDVTNFTCR
jgi:hypothetical protein